MMKCEFEEMIGKEVDGDTFSVYEAMYAATPENVTKQQFVAMLDADAIPESAAAVARRAENAAVVADIKKQIADIREQIKFEKERLAVYEEWNKEGLWTPSLKSQKDYIKKLKAQVRELQFIIR